MTLDKLNDGATLESLKAKLRSYSYTKRTNISADHASCFYSNGKDFGSLQVKTHSRFSGSLHTTQEVNLSSDDAKRYESSGGGGDRVPMTVSYSLGANERRIEELEPSSIAYVDSGANRHYVNRLVRLSDERPSLTSMIDATGRMTKLDSDGELTIGVVDDKGQSMDPIIITASRNNSSPMNLLSVSKLCKLGLSFHFSERDSHFTYQGKRFTLVEENGMYIIRLNELLRAEEFDAICSIPGAANDESIALAATYTLWHERLGHASHQRLKFMYDNGMAEGFDVGGKHKHDKKCKCANCLSIHNAKVHIGDTRKFDDDITQRGELVCTDLAGPFPADVHGHRYVISFTDFYSRFGTCYFLKRKSEAESALKAYLLFCRQEGVIVKRIRSDNGGEYGGHNDGANRRQRLFGQDGSAEYVFDRVCRANNIKHELTPHDRPEHNGLAERWNQTVIGMANAMLFSARLSHVLWTSAVAHANMIRNRLPIQGLGKFTPYELWYHKRPRVDQLKVFGSDCYKLLPKFPKVPGQQAREKLIYVGETADRLGFRTFNPRTYKFTTEFELVFDENSLKDRGLALRQFDERRNLHAAGKLDALPLLWEDVKGTTKQALDVERNVYQDHYSDEPHSVPQQQERLTLETFNTTDSKSAPALDEKEDGNELSGLPTDSVLRKEANAHITSSRQRATSQPDLLTAQHSLDTPLQLSGSRMGGPLGARQRAELITPRNAPSSTCQREPKGTVDGRPVDAYPHKAIDNRDGQPKYHSEATELARADKVGPLTREALETERKASEFDPRQPRRPLRRLPVGAEEKDNEDAKNFRRFALENNILIQMVDNPKRRGKDSWKRYNLYQNASTLREIIELSVTSRDAAARATQMRKAREDIKYDFLHGYILFPQYETNSPSHFVNAGEIALMANVMNIHQLYSEEEMDQARQAAEAEKASEAARMIEEKCKQI